MGEKTLAKKTAEEIEERIIWIENLITDIEKSLFRIKRYTIGLKRIVKKEAWL